MTQNASNVDEFVYWPDRKTLHIFQSVSINILQSVCESAESVPLTVVGIVERSIASLAFCKEN